MFQWISGRMRCAQGVHERNIKRVRPTPEGSFVSACRFCSTPMFRRGKRDWIAL